jgi:hypothetical protein
MKPYKKIFNNHSKEFLKILKEASPDKAIKAITHLSPLLVFWVTPEGKVLDAHTAHYDNPPNEDRSILSSKNYKGHLRGRAALIGDIVYIVIYKESLSDITSRQIALLRRSYPSILRMIKQKNKDIDEKKIDKAHFIDEAGEIIHI